MNKPPPARAGVGFLAAREPRLSENEIVKLRVYDARPEWLMVSDEPVVPGAHSLKRRYLRARGFDVSERWETNMDGERRLCVWASWPHGDI